MFFIKECGQKLSSAKSLKTHMKHHKEPEFKCPHEGCVKGFITRLLLRNHIVIIFFIAVLIIFNFQYLNFFVFLENSYGSTRSYVSFLRQIFLQCKSPSKAHSSFSRQNSNSLFYRRVQIFSWTKRLS